MEGNSFGSIQSSTHSPIGPGTAYAAGEQNARRFANNSANGAAILDTMAAGPGGVRAKLMRF